ncbi:MAG TPA: DNA polymerase/3'-5' exonuclease PolX [Bacteroidota bacterium]|nr:DNA polymerase/3'-5' exonuclease PolX [Bacteroidota bacterium]
MPDKKRIAQILDEIGTLLELKGENRFKCIAFHNGSRVVESLTKDLNELIESGELRKVKGIGPGLATEITALVKTGKSKYYDELSASFPPGLLEMLRIQGMGPKKVKVLYEELNIKNIDELKAAIADHRLEKLAGFGKKSEENILLGIEALTKHADKHLYYQAKEAADKVYSLISQQKDVIRCEIAGSLRRRKEIIGDIDIVASAPKKGVRRIMEAFSSHPDVEKIIGQGETKTSVLLNSGINCDLRVVQDSEFPFAMAYFTGSKEHNVEMRSLAKKFGWSLNEYGFSLLGGEEKRGAAKQIVKCDDEADIYKALKLEYVPPELREMTGEFDAARAGTLPTLIENDDIRGTFHCHTTYSDGKNTLAEMAAAARALTWEYLGIADHSKVAAYAGGLSEARVKQQHKEIDALNGKFSKFRLFKGTEVDILPDGSLDWSDKVLASFDYVVASVHSKFKMTESEATKRIIKALKNKHVTMLGHATGRLLLQRDGYPVNMVSVIDAAADYGKIIEINSHPLRLDLDWRLCRYAREKGVMLSINPDAHNIHGLTDVYYGVGIARKGWIEKENVLNTGSLDDIIKYFKPGA